MPQKTAAKRGLLPRKAPSQERSKAKVEQILQAARELLESTGLEKLSTNSIAKQAGMSVGSLYQYFPNKQAIIFELYQRWLQEAQWEMLQYEIGSNESNQPLTKDSFRDLLKALLTEFGPQGSSDYERELDKAMQLYPELEAMDREHGEKMAAIFSGMFKQLGVTSLNDKELLQLGTYSYELYCMYWDLIVSGNGDQALTLEWTINAFLGIAEKYLPV